MKAYIVSWKSGKKSGQWFVKAADMIAARGAFLRQWVGVNHCDVEITAVCAA